jgi:hypothetical protein
MINHVCLEEVGQNVRWRMFRWVYSMGSGVLDYLRTVHPACSWRFRENLHNNPCLLRNEYDDEKSLMQMRDFSIWLIHRSPKHHYEGIR